MSQDGPKHPLQRSGDERLLMFANATRRAGWNARLGLMKRPMFRVNIPSLDAAGGSVPAITVVVQRIYPMMFVETTADGQKCVRTQREEAIAIEEIRHQIAAGRRGEEVLMDRRVTNFVSMDVTDMAFGDEICEKNAERYTVTVWRPSEDLMTTLAEGCSVEIQRLNCSKGPDGSLRLSTTRYSSWDVISRAPHKLFQPRSPAQFDGLEVMKFGSRFDTVGIVVLIGEPRSDGIANRTVFCWDGNESLLAVNVGKGSWEAHERMFVVGNVISMSNLSYRTWNKRLNIHDCAVTSESLLSVKPKFSYLKNRHLELQKQVEQPSSKDMLDKMAQHLMSTLRIGQPQTQASTPSGPESFVAGAAPRFTVTKQAFSSYRIPSSKHISGSFRQDGLVVGLELRTKEGKFTASYSLDNPTVCTEKELNEGLSSTEEEDAAFLSLDVTFFDGVAALPLQLDGEALKQLLALTSDVDLLAWLRKLEQHGQVPYSKGRSQVAEAYVICHRLKSLQVIETRGDLSNVLVAVLTYAVVVDEETIERAATATNGSSDGEAGLPDSLGLDSQLLPEVISELMQTTNVNCCSVCPKKLELCPLIFSTSEWKGFRTLLSTCVSSARVQCWLKADKPNQVASLTVDQASLSQ